MSAKNILNKRSIAAIKVAATLIYRAIEGVLIFPWLMMGGILILEFAAGNNPIIGIIETSKTVSTSDYESIFDGLRNLHLLASIFSVAGLFAIYGWRRFIGWPERESE